MKRFTDYRAIFFKPNGEMVYYPMKIGDSHQQLLFDFCKDNGIDYPSIDSLLKHQYGGFYHANNGIFIAFLPNSLTEEEYYALDLQTNFMDDITYMEVHIDEKAENFTLKNDVGDNFSKQVLQYYFDRERDAKKSI